MKEIAEKKMANDRKPMSAFAADTPLSLLINPAGPSPEPTNPPGLLPKGVVGELEFVIGVEGVVPAPLNADSTIS